MIPRSKGRLAAPALAFALAFGLTACGGDDEGPTSPTTPAPDIAGRYSLTWTLQVLRKSDGFQKQFDCYGTMTLVQGTGTGSPSLSGFAAVTSRCAPESYNLTGTVGAGGAIEFTTDSPKPPEGTCPGGKNVHFSGQITTSGSRATLSARGVTTVTCPEFGDHQYSYLIYASR